MKHSQLFAFLPVVAAAVVLTGCATTDDPREGGLFGYLGSGEEAYQRRLDDRRFHLATLEGENAAQQVETRRLEGRRSQLTRQRDRLGSMKRELDVAASKAASRPGGQKLQIEIRAAQERLSAIEAKQEITEAEVKQAAAEVQREKRKLQLLLESN